MEKLDFRYVTEDIKKYLESDLSKAVLLYSLFSKDGPFSSEVLSSTLGNKDNSAFEEIEKSIDLKTLKILLNQCQTYRMAGKSVHACEYFLLSTQYFNWDDLTLYGIDLEIKEIVYKLLEEFTIFSYYLIMKISKRNH